MHESVLLLRNFGEISGLKLNSKKTKAIWIGSSKKQMTKPKPLEINIARDPIRTLGTYISRDRDKNNNLNFFVKIQKMETKLNIWLSRDHTLMGRLLLEIPLGISKFVYTASMLSVSQEVIKKVQAKLFNFFMEKQKRENKKRSSFSRDK